MNGGEVNREPNHLGMCCIVFEVGPYHQGAKILLLDFKGSDFYYCIETFIL